MAEKKAVPVVDKNRHVKEYLEYYLNLHHPGFAVLLNGTWGIGKTYLIKKFLYEHFEDTKDFVYVSLFGLKMADDIDAVLFQAMYPALGWKVTKLAGRLSKAAMKFFRFEPDIKSAEVLNKFNASVYVFDDFERCDLPINALLGYINEFVEHGECRVLIIANEEDIGEQDEYRKRREKLIGKTLEVQSAFDDAIVSFTSQIDDPGAKSLFETAAAEISAIYHQSGLNNLRILQQTMWDFERLFRVLTDEHRKHNGAIKVLLRLFFAFYFELKAGRIQAKDLTSRLDKIVAGQMQIRENDELTPLAAADARYPEITLHDTILSDELLVDILVKGIIDTEKIRESFDRSPYFVEKSEEPSWRATWHYFERSNEEFETSYKQMEKQFAAREFTVTGEILHVFGLRLRFADTGVSEMSRAEVVSEGKKYIDDLYKQGRLDPEPMDNFDFINFSGYDGLGFAEGKTKELRELFEFYREKQNRAKEDKYPEKAIDLIKEMESDPDLFFRRLNSVDSEDSIYYREPILASIDPGIFSSTLLKLHPKDQRTIFGALKSRYEYGHLDRELGLERPWLATVRDKLMEAAETMPPIGKYRLNQNIEWNIAPLLKEEKQANSVEE